MGRKLGRIPVETANSGIHDEFGDLENTTQDADLFIKSPELAGTMKNINTVSGNFGAASSDFQTKFHAFLYPLPCVGWKCHLKTDFEIVKAAGSLAEPAYWLRQLILP